MTSPRTRYARTQDGKYIAYQVSGDGPIDVLVVFGYGISIEEQASGRWSARFIERLGSFARVIRFDRRGTGRSDPVLAVDENTFEKWLEDAVTVLDAVGSTDVMAVTTDTGATNMVVFWVATHPQRFSRLVLCNPFVRFLAAPDYPIGTAPETTEALVQILLGNWLEGTGLLPSWGGPDDDEEFLQWFGDAARRSLSPSSALALYRNALETDLRAVLPAIRVPTLVVVRGASEGTPMRERILYVADHLPGAQMVELPGAAHVGYAGDSEAFAQEIEEFFTGSRSEAPPDRVLATVLFTDLVASTQRAARAGDKAWRAQLDAHDAMVRGALGEFRGREVKTLGDGFLASFDGPARAIRCGQAIVRGAERLGQQVRIGLHAGEVELRGDDIGGVTVNIAARVVAAAAPSEVLVSRTVVDLVAGSGLTFTDRGEHSLKGVDGSWRLFAADYPPTTASSSS